MDIARNLANGTYNSSDLDRLDLADFRMNIVQDLLEYEELTTATLPSIEFWRLKVESLIIMLAEHDVDPNIFISPVKIVNNVAVFPDSRASVGGFPVLVAYYKSRINIEKIMKRVNPIPANPTSRFYDILEQAIRHFMRKQ